MAAVAIAHITLLLASAGHASVVPIKRSIIKLARGTDNGVTADPGTAAQIVALTHLLEEQNPTPDVSESPLVAGCWELVYTDTSSSSAGRLGPFVGRVQQRFDDFPPTRAYSNLVLLGPGDADLVKGELKATWDVEDTSTWKVTFQSISFSVLGLPLVKDKPLSQVGIWRHTYMDEDFRVLYAQSGIKPASIYVLARATLLNEASEGS